MRARAHTHTHTHTRCIQVGELVDVLNSLFSSIDFAAKCIGNVWKVETIGDCYIGVIGGPNPCEDHADRALLLAASILDIVRCMSSALTFPLRVRIGVHSGHLSAAVIGQLLPRYLVFGPDLEVVNHLEALAEPQQVEFARSLSVAALRARSLMYVYIRSRSFPPPLSDICVLGLSRSIPVPLICSVSLSRSLPSVLLSLAPVMVCMKRTLRRVRVRVRACITYHTYTVCMLYTHTYTGVRCE